MPSVVSSQGESDFTPLSPGTHVGRCHQVINIGMHASGPWSPKAKHYIGFEVPSERVTWTDKEGVEHEGPAIIGSRYTSSLSPKATLRQHLESWRGALFTDEQLKAFDLFHLIGQPALISVVHSEDGKYANITSIMRPPQGIVCPPAELPQIAYDPSDPNAHVAFAQLTQRMQETVTRGQEQSPVIAAPGGAPGAGHVYVPPPMSENPAPGYATPPRLRPPNGIPPTSPPGHFAGHTQGQEFDDDIPF